MIKRKGPLDISKYCLLHSMIRSNSNRVLGVTLVLIWNLVMMSCSHPECVPRENGGSTRTLLPSNIIIKPGREGKDAQVSHYDPEKNFGDRRDLNALSWKENGLSYTERGFIDFNLEKYLPKGVRITSAHLKLFADTVKSYYGNTGHSNVNNGNFDLKNNWQLCRVLNPWDESTITWFDQPVTSETDVLNLSAPEFSSQGYTIDVTEYIKQEYEGVEGYHGFMIRLRSENAYQSVIFCSSDCEQKELRPELWVEYEM
ncbi:MAG: DNRLRE domain-containing protein [Sporocytophaga sp.]|uniref:DNRLRE domain-containing protein n=1 Tax=Sporocytophaga sp. TaxID=2231183 RepID=UPI001B0CA09C|nr:DNRLRE domain-containing protein [Sporocytophaga sp.]MBO9699480.1 DNRLRE domain-containing protein [Sporocytophaga sp.]